MATMTAAFSYAPPRLRSRYMPSAQAQGRARSSGRFRRSPTEANAFPLRSGTVAAETPGPRRISETSSVLLVETPARYISVIASSTLASRLR